MLPLNKAQQKLIIHSAMVYGTMCVSLGTDSNHEAKLVHRERAKEAATNFLRLILGRKPTVEDLEEMVW
jgi:hypothetical protein